MDDNHHIDVRPAAFWIAFTTMLCLSGTCLGVLVYLLK